MDHTTIFVACQLTIVRIRKLRCDEEKPACNRCVSTGRTCDGYAPKSQTAQTAQIHQASPSCIRPRLALPRGDAQELRSFRLFVDVAAPSFAGVFEFDFWLGEIPRASYHDIAIWHAVVSLGAVYESFLLSGGSSAKATVFALQQFNLSIKALTGSTVVREGKWRALTASAVFACLCSIQGLHDEARLHIKAGRRLLSDMDKDEAQLMASSSSRRRLAGQSAKRPKGAAIPVSITPLRGIITSLETQARALENGGLTKDSSLVAENESFSIWRLYQAPCTEDEMSKSASTSARFTTNDNLIRAHRAAESLLNGLVLFSQHCADDTGEILTTGSQDKVESLVKRQEPYARCCVELSRALRAFNREFESGAAERDTGREAGSTLNRLLTLELFLVSIRMSLFQDPEMPDQSERVQVVASQNEQVVSLSTRILAFEHGKQHALYSPVPSTTQPLFIVILNGFPHATRKKALELLRQYPRREGLWDTVMAVALSEAMMQREQVVLREWLEKQAGVESETSLGQEMDVPLLFRMHDLSFVFTGERQARISMRTWREWMDGRPGQKVMLAW
ncbi:hypothetical protein G7046_g9020 [Stylonectria norvegica]|nr:hypothetical protein G7046_g9020 [Stylonectria norvegica]